MEEQELFVRMGRNAYRADEVDNYVATTRQQLVRLEKEKSDLEGKLILLAKKIEEYRADEDSLKAALLGAQRFGDSIVKEAKQKADSLLNDANVKASQMEDAAKAQADSILISLREEIDVEKKELARLQKESGKFREELKKAYLAQLANVEKLPGEVEDATEEEEETPIQPIVEDEETFSLGLEEIADLEEFAVQ